MSLVNEIDTYLHWLLEFWKVNPSTHLLKEGHAAHYLLEILS